MVDPAAYKNRTFYKVLSKFLYSLCSGVRNCNNVASFIRSRPDRDSSRFSQCKVPISIESRTQISTVIGV